MNGKALKTYEASCDLRAAYLPSIIITCLCDDLYKNTMRLKFFNKTEEYKNKKAFSLQVPFSSWTTQNNLMCIFPDLYKCCYIDMWVMCRYIVVFYWTNIHFMFISVSWLSCHLSRSRFVACFLIAAFYSIVLCLFALHLKLFLYMSLQ